MMRSPSGSDCKLNITRTSFYICSCKLSCKPCSRSQSVQNHFKHVRTAVGADDASIEATQGRPRTNHHTRDSEREGRAGLDCFERKPKESSNGEPPGVGLHSIYTRIHVGCVRLSIGLCTVHDIIVELRARLYDIKGGSMHSTRHRSRLL